MWKGELKLGTTRVPVKLYSAVQDRTVRFHILDDRAKKRVKQHMIDPDSGDEVPTKEIQKGYEIDPGRYVILAKEDLEKLERLEKRGAAPQRRFSTLLQAQALRRKMRRRRKKLLSDSAELVDQLRGQRDRGS